MKKIFGIIIAVVLTTSSVNAEVSEAKKLCDAETKKEQPRKSVLEKQCGLLAKEYEVEKKFFMASWYYLLAGDNQYNISIIEQKIFPSSSRGNIANSYVVLGQYDKAEGIYKNFLIGASIPWADEAIRYDYNLLYKLYPKQKENLDKGLALWNEMYKPLLKVNALYPQYEKAKKEKKYKEAIEHLLKVIVIQRESGLQNNLAIADNEHELGVVYTYNKEYKESLEVFHKVEKIYKNEESKRKSLGYLYGWIADNYENLNNNKKAIIYYSKAINIKERVLGKEHASTAGSYSNMGGLYESMGDYSQALSYYKKSLAIQEKVLGKEHPKTAGSYINMGGLYKSMGDYPRALSYLKKSVEISEKVLGKEHPNTAISYSNMGGLYKSMGDYPRALSYLKKSVEVSEKVLGKEHTLTAEIYNKIGGLYNDIGDYPKALSYLKKSLEISEKVLGKEHASTAKIYNNLSTLYDSMGDYPQALSYLKKSVEISERVLGKEHASTAVDYNNIGGLYNNIGDYPKALSYLKKSLEISEKVLGKEHASTAVSYSNMGGLYESMGDYPKALSYYQKALVIYKKVLGKEHPKTAVSYSNMGGLYESMGDYSQALSYYQKALAIQEKVLGKGHPDTATNYNNIGGLYNDIGDYPKALSYLKKSLEISEKVLGKEHPKTAVSYSYMGEFYKSMGDYPRALSYLKKSVEISEKVLGKEHALTAASYNNIGGLYAHMGDYPRALSYLKNSLDISEKVLGKVHPKAVTTYSNIGILYHSMEDYPKAYYYAKKSYVIFLLHRDKSFTVLDSKQKEKFLEANVDQISLLLHSTYMYSKDKNSPDTLTQSTFTDWLNYKGSIFDSENAIATLYINTKDKALKEKIDTLVSSKRRLAKLYQSLPKPKEREQWKKNIKDTEEKISSLTSEISSKAESFKESQGLKSINYKNISKNLKKDELYIDYAKAGEYYYVFSLDSEENTSFTQIDENSTKKIDTLVKTFREDVMSILDDNNLTDDKLENLTTASKEKLSQLYELVLSKPLSKQLKTKTNIILSPDGALRLLPFEAMYDKKNSKYLIEQKEIRYIPSGKELVRLYRYSNTKKETKAIAKQNHTATIFSNPNFDAKDIAKVASQAKEEEIAITPNTNRAGIIKSLFKMRFTPLPGTKAEAQSIEQTLKDKTEITEYKQEEANEVNLMNIKQPKILHIATHGFFINDNTIPNPMLKSGIALSGANASAIKGKSDGIVTALKLSGLDLKGTDLVVLSACQTGVVDVNSTDSVSGLSKAFIQAGAKDIVMSLWSVNDQATKELMSSFYKQMQTHPSYAKALKEAKLKMIEQGIHPFFWAAFVVSGL